MSDRLIDLLARQVARRRVALGSVGLLLGAAAPERAVAACKVVGKTCKRAADCCTGICTGSSCRCPDGRKGCHGLCCGAAEACQKGSCCTTTGSVCPVDPTDCCSSRGKHPKGGCSGAHHHCCVTSGACASRNDCCFANQTCQEGLCCFLAGATCGAGERCCSGVCNSLGECT